MSKFIAFWTLVLSTHRGWEWILSLVRSSVLQKTSSQLVILGGCRQMCNSPLWLMVLLRKRHELQQSLRPNRYLLLDHRGWGIQLQFVSLKPLSPTQPHPSPYSAPVLFSEWEVGKRAEGAEWVFSAGTGGLEDWIGGLDWIGLEDCSPPTSGELQSTHPIIQHQLKKP